MNTCLNCGFDNSSSAALCQQCGELMTEEVRESIEALPEGIDVSQGSGFWIRALARMIDFVYSYLLSYGAATLFGLIMLLLGMDHILFEIQTGSTLPTTIGAFVAAILYHSICESIYGATLGKLICKLRVITLDGKPCSFTSAIIRNLLYFGDTLFFGLVGYMAMSKNTLNQRFGDRFAKTVVVKSLELPETSKKTPGQFLIAFMLGTMVYCFVVFAGLWVMGN